MNYRKTKFYFFLTKECAKRVIGRTYINERCKLSTEGEYLTAWQFVEDKCELDAYQRTTADQLIKNGLILPKITQINAFS